MPQHFENCKHFKTTDIVKSHPVNLGLLLHFHDLEKLSNIPGDTLFDNPPVTNIHNFHIFRHNYTKLLARDHNFDLSVDLIAKAAQKDTPVYHSLVEPLLQEMARADQIVGSTDIIAYTALTLASTVLFMVCALFYKVNIMAAAAVVSAALPPVHPFAVPTQVVHLFPTTTMIPTHVPNISPSIIDTQTEIFLITIILAVIAVLLYKYFQKKMHTELILEFTDGNNCVLVPITVLTFCHNYYHFQSAAPINNIDLTGYLFPTLSWSWNGLKVTDMMDGVSVALPNRIKLSFLNALRLRSLGKSEQKYRVYLFITHAGRSFHIRPCPPHCQICVSNFTNNQIEADTLAQATTNPTAPEDVNAHS